MRKFLYHLCVAVGFLGTAVCLPAQECYTPIEWIPKNYVSNLDRNKNFVDDAIDAMDPTATIDILLCLNACASADDIDRLRNRIGSGFAYRSPYISVLLYEDVPVSVALQLGLDGRVAMVELSRESIPGNDVATRAARIRSSTDYAGINIEDVYPAINGTGVNIAIIDTGIENEPTGTPSHESFPAWKYVAGYDAIMDMEIDPEDFNSHGTSVAGVALGTGGMSGTYRGNAPASGLIDIKAGTVSLPDIALMRAFDKVIERHDDWNIGVFNLSVYTPMMNSDGTDALSQHVNRVVREGVVAVVIAGNNGNSGSGNYIGRMAAADFAITVACAHDLGTVDRTDDSIMNYSSRGPRLNDGDGITEDERKPDVAAYGEAVHTAEHNTVSGYWDQGGTSMAAPQVAGLVALILQANPGMDPLSVKELIQNTAEDYGAPGWDIEYGHGIINGFAAVDHVITSLQTDVAFNDYCGNPGNPSWWLSSDVVPQNPSIIESTPNGVTVTIYNNGSTTAANVKVRVGIYDFSNSTADFDICTHTIASLPPGPYTFTCPWTPEADNLFPPVVHACLKAYIIYPSDTDPSNNCAQRNVNIQQTHSPALFHMKVVNPTGEDADMEIVTEPTARELAARGWRLTTEQTSFRMGAHDCPRTVTLALEAVGQNPPKEIPVKVTIQRRRGQEVDILGGVQLIGQNGNGTPRPPDKAVFAGIRHTSLGQARLYSTPAQLIVSDIDNAGDDGVEAWLGQANFWRGTLQAFNTDQIRDLGFISFVPKGRVNGRDDVTIAGMKITDMNGVAQFSSDFQSRSTELMIEVYNDGNLVDSRPNDDGVFANVESPSDISITPFRTNSRGAYGEVVFGADTDIEVLGSTSSTVVTGDKIVVYPRSQPRLPSYVETVEITSDGEADFVLTGEAGGAYHRPFRAMGNPALEWKESGRALTASRITARSAVGVRAEVPNLKSYYLTWTEEDVAKVPLGAQLSLTARGHLLAAGTSDLGSVHTKRLPNSVQVTADLSQIGAGSYIALMYNGGTMVSAARNLAADICTVTDWPNGGGIAIEQLTNGPGYILLWPQEVTFTLADGSVVTGDELHILPGTNNDPLVSVDQLAVYATGLNELQIIGEQATSSIPVSVGVPEQELPFRLHQNYPNPFDQRTMFRFDLFSAAHVELEIYSLLGERVASVVAHNFAQGTHEVEWKRPGTSLPAGAYIYRIKVRPANTQQTFELQRQMLILD